MFIYHIDVVILDMDMGYGLMIWPMPVSIVWDSLSLCLAQPAEQRRQGVRGGGGGHQPPLPPPDHGLRLGPREESRDVAAQVKFESKV